MENIIIVGSGISGLSAAYYAAKKGIKVNIISPTLPERSQSVLAAGGINAYDINNPNDSVKLHIEETIKSGCYIEDEENISNLCNDANDILDDLVNMGVMFNRNKDLTVSRRAFGGQSQNRTAFAQTSTGKQIVTGLIRVLRKYEKEGLVTFLFNRHFLKALITNNSCDGIIAYNDIDNKLEVYYGDNVIIASGGPGKLYEKTTGSKLNDGYCQTSLFLQGVKLRNLEFIQYHPTSISTSSKNILISEAARGDGGRLFYLDNNNERVYFMEDKYGEKGNLMPRDIVSKEEYLCGKQIYLDISFLDKKIIMNRLTEVYDLCKTYLDLDCSTTPIPIEPAIHFFMGGIAVNEKHMTNINHLYAIGECASMYHGANRLGGNSLLAAIHSAKVAINSLTINNQHNNDYLSFIKAQEDIFYNILNNDNNTSLTKYYKKISSVLINNMGIVRDEKTMKDGLDIINEMIDDCKNIYDSNKAYDSYNLYGCLLYTKAVIESGLNRKESRGSHYRVDFKETDNSYKNTYVQYNDGKIEIGDTF